MLFLKSSLDGNTHPDPRQRLYSAPQQLKLKPSNMLWALALTALAFCAHYYRKLRVGGHKYSSLRENFEQLLDELLDPPFLWSEAPAPRHGERGMRCATEEAVQVPSDKNSSQDYHAHH